MNKPVAILSSKAGNRRLLRLLHRLLLVSLFGLLIVQGWILWQGGLPIPAFVMEKAAQMTRDQALEFSCQEARFVAPNRIELTGVRLESKANPGLALRADRVALSISPAQLLQRNMPATSIFLEGGAFTCPAELSHSGRDELLLHDTHLAASGNNRNWRIDGMALRSAGLVASVRGALPALPPDPPEPPLPTWEKTLRKTAVELSTLRSDHLAELDSARVDIDTRRNPDGGLDANLRLTVDSYRHQFGLLIEQSEAQGMFHLDAKRVSGELVLRAVMARLRDGGHLENIGARIRLDEFEIGTLPRNATIQLSTAGLTALEESAESLYLTANHANDSWIDARFYLRRDGEPLRGQAGFDWRDGKGEVRARSDLNPNEILRGPRVREAGFAFDVSFDRAPELEAELRFGPEWAPRNADLEIRSGPCGIDGVRFDTAHATAHWAPGTFEASSIILRREDFRVGGSYWNDTDTKDYQFRFSGTLRPDHLEPWFEDWWARLWEPFAFPSAPPSSGIFIRGRWGDADRVFVDGWAEGSEISLRDTAIDRMVTRYQATSTWSQISNSRIERNGQSAEGGFIHHRNSESRVTFNARSTLPTEMIGRLLGEGTDRVFRTFEFDKPPSIQASGTLIEPENGMRHPGNRMDVTINSEHGLTAFGFPLDRLAAAGQVAGTVLTLSPVNGGFADGDFQGAARIDFESETEPPRARITLSLTDAAFGPAMERIVRFTDPETDEDYLRDLHDLGGRARFETSVEGFLDDPFSFTGEGALHIRDAELGRIRLLGLLSRFLDRTPLRFTSLRLNEAESTFELDREILHFPDMELKGPNIGMEAYGDYSLASQALDFRVKLFPLRESPVPLVSEIFGRILAPFGHILEITLTGTLDDPQWRFPIDPRRARDSPSEFPAERIGPR